MCTHFIAILTYQLRNGTSLDAFQHEWLSEIDRTLLIYTEILFSCLEK